ncbi:MAG: flagellum-specific ATP synthase FliI, partial [Paracoccaceae bacterium]|nr:flagellum-specific ATP synthase FliI [Paracoccaceae bacterium]
MAGVFDTLQAEIDAVQVMHRIGRVVAIGRGTVDVAGLSDVATLGDLVKIGENLGTPNMGEVLALSGDRITVLPGESGAGLAIGDLVTLIGRNDLAPDRAWIGRVIDPFGRPLDGRPLLRGAQARPLRAAPPAAIGRRRMAGRLETGVAVFNTLLPLVRGQRVGLFAGSGVGKSTLLSKFARGVSADVVVIALIGERGREVREFIESVLG